MISAIFKRKFEICIQKIYISVPMGSIPPAMKNIPGGINAIAAAIKLIARAMEVIPGAIAPIQVQRSLILPEIESIACTMETICAGIIFFSAEIYVIGAGK
jgi:hypothetical protein